MSSYLGNTTTPTAGWDWPGGGYEFGSFFTMPAGGGGMVTDIFAFMATPSGASTGYVCVWDSTGGGTTLLISARYGALPSGSQSAGGQQWIGVHLGTPVFLSGGQGVYIGGYGSGNIVFSSGVGGTSRVKSVGSGGPANFSGNVASGIGIAGAYFAYDAISAPTISSVTPGHGIGGTSLALVGSQYTYATGVTVGGISASFSITDDSHMTVTVPGGVAAGSVSIVVTNPSGTGSISWTEVGAPTVTSATPNVGVTGTSVAVVGTGFTYATGVTIGGASASFTITDDAHLTATVPGGAAAGPGTLVVTNQAGSASIAFIVGGIAHVRRSGAWVTGTVSVRRSGVWTQNRVRVRRSGAWVDAS